jgi:hypothetical protein
MFFSNPIVKTMFPNVVEFISQGLDDPVPIITKQQWISNCESLWNMIEGLTAEESKTGSSILSILLNATNDFLQLVEEKQQQTTNKWSLEDRKKMIEILRSRPQIEQRTDDWYLDALGLLSASQFSSILKSSRTRGQIVLQKAVCTPIDVGNRRTVVLTEDLNPFTWGIRFEPIVKQIYQDLTKTVVIDLGRLKHQKDPRIAASPDGLVTEGPDHRLGRFVEFKAPVTRKIIQKVPEDYMMQMQIQMEVGNVEECDYLEVKFQSLYPKLTPDTVISANATYRGCIAILGDEEGHLLRYEYSPLQEPAWQPTLQGTEQVLELIPWWTSDWFLKTVPRSREWFESVQPAIETFWKDVQKAKEGTFVLPPSSRKIKDPVCQITDESDTQGNQQTIPEMLG